MQSNAARGRAPLTPIGSQPNAGLLRFHLLTYSAGVQTGTAVSVGNLHVVLSVMSIVMIVAVMVMMVVVDNDGWLPNLCRRFRVLYALAFLTRRWLFFHTSSTVNLNDDTGYQLLNAFDFASLVRFIIGGHIFAVALAPLGKLPVSRTRLRIASQ